MKFENKVALITGAYQGLGKGISKKLGEQGCKIILVDIDEKVKDTEKEFTNIGIDSISVIGDVSKESTANLAIEKGVKKYSKIDILVNNAGIGGIKKWDLPVDELDRVYAINLRGVFIFCKFVIPLMLKNKYGRIVNIASIAGKEGNPNAVPYSATKSAVIGLTKSLGKELAKTEIRVNCVTPAVIRTSILDEFTEEHINYMLEKIPMGRTGEIEEVANMVAWIASEECSFSTGAVFDISGGRATY